ncbi:MAG: hypothetical protein GXO73_13925 [Calditrichaeota bacterium]|nr:hypothetical protein [Calditrichota bacterium]
MRRFGVWLWSRVVLVWRRFSGELKRRAVLAQLEPGDIILASPPTRRLSPVALVYRVVLGARYVHSMIYIGRGRIVHTTSRFGVVVGKAPRGIHRSDRYTILRVPQLSLEQQRQLVQEALRWQGRRLDTAGLIANVPRRLLGVPRRRREEDVDRVWCSKFVAVLFRKVGVELVPDDQLGSVTSEDLAASPVLQRVR